jgi:GTP-binding protein
MEGYFQSGRNIKLVVQLVDMRHKPSADDINMIEFLNYVGIPYIIVMTKSDKLKVKEYQKRLELSKEELSLAGDAQIIPFSATNGKGLNEIKKAIEKSIS